jgi:hypothetical protein
MLGSKDGPHAWSHKVKNVETYPTIITFTIIFSIVSCFNNLLIASKRHIDAHYDPTSVPNGCWGQKMHHFLGIIKSKMSKLTLPLLRLRPSSPSSRALTICASPLSGICKRIMIQLRSQTDVGVKRCTTFLVS